MEQSSGFFGKLVVVAGFTFFVLALPDFLDEVLNFTPQALVGCGVRVAHDLAQDIFFAEQSRLVGSEKLFAGDVPDFIYTKT